MSVAPLETMTLGEIYEYVETLEAEVKTLRKKSDNTKKLDRRDAERMRALYASEKWTQAELAEAFAVNDATVSRIVRGIYYAAV